MAGDALRLVDAADARAVAALTSHGETVDPAVVRRAATIVRSVRRGGDRALRRLAARYDDLDGPLELTGREIAEGAEAAPRETRRAIGLAARNIRRVARRQLPRPWAVVPVRGVRVEQRVVPLDSVGCYVPAGRHPLPSSLLMTAVPAKVARVPLVAVACPRPDPVVLAAAVEAGVDRLFRIGGAQAIAALAYGTESVPRVDKIVGPGNAYVAAAKAMVSGDCPIDFRAGPSEIVIVAQDGDPRWIAADLIAQAEHDPDARALLITPSRRLARRVASQVARRVPSDGPAREALQRRGAAIVTRSLDEAIDLANDIAPEHVVCDTDAVAVRVTRCGTAFVGAYSAQAAGDYVTGSNHVLPTGGAARHRGGLSAADFVRVSSVQRLTAAGLRRLGPAAVTLAEAEGLTAHARSITTRLS